MMTATITQVRIYNRTLALLGSTHRTSNLDDGQSVTDTLNAHWPFSMRALLAAHPWNCAIARAKLNKGEADALGEGYLYQLPADCLRWLPWSRDSEFWFDGVEEGGFILATGGDAQISIRYIRLLEDVSRWAAHMTDAMALRLAWDAAEAITQSSGIAEAMRERYEGSDGQGGALAIARGIDGLASGRRARGNVSQRSRALAAAYEHTQGNRVPGIDY